MSIRAIGENPPIGQSGNRGVVTNQTNFFLPGSDFHKCYEHVRDFDLFANHKTFVEQLWQQFCPLADPDFLEDAKTHFPERFWEMYLAYVLMERGYKLDKHGTYGPDFYFHSDNVTVCIEATVPGAGKGPDRVPPLSGTSDMINQGLEPIAQEVPEDKIILRFTNAIDEKRKKYDKYLADEIISPTDKCIIGINGGEVLPRLFDEFSLPYIVKSLFPLGKFSVTFDRDFNIVSSRHQYRPKITKSSGKDVPTNPFLDENYQGITGVLYNNVDAVNDPERAGDKFIFIHNPLARNPLPRNFFKFGTEYYVENDELYSNRH